MRPFFGYYGGKWRDTPKHYPPPRHGTIVEPFAGSAGYSLRYPERQVALFDADPIIVGVWRYLIRTSAPEILALPDITDGQTTDDLRVCQEARWLIGFWLNRGCSAPRKSPSSWMRQGLRPGSFWGPTVRQRLAAQVDGIRHWTIEHRSYEDVPNRSATWFIDPPYRGAGDGYRFGSAALDYQSLAEWTLSRSGQIIACEAAGADWLPFATLGDIKTTRAGVRSPEAVWVR